MDWRDERFGELLAMKSANPSRLIMIFRKATDLGELERLPMAFGLNEMIAVILDREERRHESLEVTTLHIADSGRSHISCPACGVICQYDAAPASETISQSNTEH